MARRASLAVLVFFWLSPVWAAPDIFPAFLGMYRKTMEIDDELSTHAARYGVDPRVARAVIIQESGSALARAGCSSSSTDHRHTLELPAGTI